MVIIISLFSNALALYVANLLVPGFSIIGGWKEYVIGGIVLGLLNLLVRPVVKVVTFPLIIISLGLFLIVINALMLWLAAELTGYILIESYFALLWATLIISAVNFVARWFK